MDAGIGQSLQSQSIKFSFGEIVIGNDVCLFVRGDAFGQNGVVGTRFQLRLRVGLHGLRHKLVPYRAFGKLLNPCLPGYFELIGLLTIGRFERLYRVFQSQKLFLLRPGWRCCSGFVVRTIHIRRLVKKGVKLVVFSMLDWIVLMGVAFRASHGEAHPNLQGGINAIFNCEHAEFLVICSPLVVGHGVSMECRCELLVRRWIVKQISCNLFDRKLIKG